MKKIGTKVAGSKAASAAVNDHKLRPKRLKSKVSFAPSEIGYEASQYLSPSVVSDTTSFRTDSDMRESN